ncbi:MAG TPA: DUF1572 family protein [Puia sp.]|jgi:hypothetical protein|nr:DUF1572 family protein [Puia sp.]
MFEENYIESVKIQFLQYKKLGEKAIDQVPEDKIYWSYNPESNSIVTIVKHMSGNMLSRFTDFYTSDGEKKWRNRDGEFENEMMKKVDLLEKWNEGWNSLFNILNTLSAESLSKKVKIRNEPHTVMEAINRQLTHYAYHVGQIIFLSKMICDTHWKSLSIPKGKSDEINTKMGL